MEVITAWIDFAWVLGAGVGCWSYLWLLGKAVAWALRRQQPPWMGLFVLLKGVPMITLWVVFSQWSSFMVLLSLTLGVTLGVILFSVSVLRQTW